MKKFLLVFALLGNCLWCNTIFARQELVQILSFRWDDEAKKLIPISIGSGTIIAEDFVLTAKHVVSKEDGTPADFSLLCMSGISKDYSINCDIKAKVVAFHDKYDAALLRPVDARIYMPDIRHADFMLAPGTLARIMYFPLSQQKILEYGANTTFDNILEWMDKGGELTTGEEKEIVLRGELTSIGVTEENGAVYYLTDIKSEVDSFGGAAFDSSYNYLGIPVKRDSNLNAMILSYNQLEGWVKEQMDLNIRPEIPSEILNYYLTKIRQPKIISNRKRLIQKSLKEKNVLSNIFVINSLKKQLDSRPEQTWAKITQQDRDIQAHWNPRVIASRKQRVQSYRNASYYLRTQER